MRTISLPYGRSTLDLHVDEEHLEALVETEMGSLEPDPSEEWLVRQALATPLGTPRLSDLARGKRRVVLVTSDHTRAVPSRVTLPPQLAEIRTGNPDAQVTILIATGLHRATTEEEQRRMFGDRIVDEERIVCNDAFDPSQFVDLGTLPSGASFKVNRLVTECDLLICEGLVEPHFFAGFSGGRKSILPGICAEETVKENHSYRAIASPHALTGVLAHNPIHEDMVVAARRVGVAFILNVALNAHKQVIGAWAGDLEQAHAAGVAHVRRCSQCAPVTGDIVITTNGGYPLDQNLYQSPKAVATAEACAGEDGVIVMCCSCVEGMGGGHFAELIQMGTPEEIDAYLSGIPAKRTIPEQWCPQIYARILRKHQMVLVSELDPETVRRCNMIPAASPDEALAIARGIRGRDARVVVIPDGVSVLAVAP
ncbi:MAG: nickel-dependent lactate racemase [Acidobacteriota bacterium]|nr:nickel-dependent lactate racemase [Acidobacteriota bacterium]